MMSTPPSPHDEVDAGSLEAFVARCTEALGHQVQGCSEPLLELWSHADDVAILGAIGSFARGWEQVRTHLLGAARTLDWSDLEAQRLQTTSSGDLGVTVVLERMRQDGATRTLRATQVYRRENGRWRLILRHANTVTPDDEAREQALLGG